MNTVAHQRLFQESRRLRFGMKLHVECVEKSQSAPLSRKSSVSLFSGEILAVSHLERLKTGYSARQLYIHP